MCKKIVVITCLCFAVLVSCKKASNVNPEAELLEIVGKLKVDKNHEFLKTLKPAKEDLYKIFKNKELAEKAIAYSEGKWGVLDNIPDDAMKPLNEDDQVKITYANKAQLKQWKYNGLSQDYVALHEFINDDVVVYGINYFNDKTMDLKSRAAFFRVGNKWIFIPQAFKAFF